MKNYPVTALKIDSTIILPCRNDDLFIWVKDTSSMWSSERKYDIADLWQMKDGDQVIFTNRLDDVPPTYPIHPSMVAGRFNVNRMLQKLNSGYAERKIGNGLSNLPEVWKLSIGDYIIWSGIKRPNLAIENGILGIFEFDAGSLGIIQNYSDRFDSSDDATPIFAENLEPIREAMEFIRRNKIKRTGADKWTLG